MAEDYLPYERWIEDALRGVLRRVLSKVEAEGLRGDHHIYITFETTHDGVEVPEFLAAQFPDEITIVLQHQFRELLVTRQSLEVVLSFSGKSCRLRVPFAAVTAFADPSVNFGVPIKRAAGAGEDADMGDATNQGDPGTKDGMSVDQDPGQAPTPFRTGPAAAPARAEAETDEFEDGDGGEEGGEDEDDAGEKKASAEVIALDAFRKK